MSTFVADASLELTLSDSKNIRTNIKIKAMETSKQFLGFNCVRDDDDDDGDDVIFVEGTPKQKTGQMDSLTPFWATKAREVFLPDLWANQNGKYPVKQK